MIVQNRYNKILFPDDEIKDESDLQDFKDIQHVKQITLEPADNKKVDLK